MFHVERYFHLRANSFAFEPETVDLRDSICILLKSLKLKRSTWNTGSEISTRR